MANSLLCTYSQLYQPRFYMHFFSQTTLVHEVRINITIARFRINQNRNTLITNLTFHLNDWCLMIGLPVVHSCIASRNVITNITNYMCLLSTIDMQSTTTPILQKILLMMILTTYPTLQWFSTTASSLFLSMSFLSCIESLVTNYILSLSCILMSSLLWWQFSFSFLISFEARLRLNFTLWFLITMFELLDDIL